MREKNIKKAFKDKNINYMNMEYIRGCPTPTGYTTGWDY